LGVLIAVVACFFALLHVPITAARRLAGVAAAVPVVVVGVVAALSRPLVPITATRTSAAVDAGVGLDLVAVVAGLEAEFALVDIQAPNTVATACRLATVGAGVFSDLVSVVACFEPCVQMSIATARVLTGGRACVVVAVVAVIAAFPRLDFTITTTRIPAFVGAAILVVLVSVVALFDTDVDDAITAARHAAAVGARILVHAISIITGFMLWVVLSEICSGEAVPATGTLALIGAGVFIDIVSVIAGFTERCDSIATASRRTRVGAGVFVDAVAIVAGFVAGLAGIDVAPRVAVTACGQSTGRQTGILFIAVSVVTGFAGLADAVAARGQPTFVAAIQRFFVAIITPFTRTQHAIAATCCNTTVATTVGVNGVAIVAGFITFNALVAVLTRDPIAAARGFAG
jgi:hypothetical protein